MRTEIYIENNQLDLDKDLSCEFTYSIDDIKDFATRNTAFSKTIILPGNGSNNRIFGSIFEFGSANPHYFDRPNVGINFNAARSANCLVFVDKIQIFKGIIKLLEVIIDKGSVEYEVAVFGELGGFISTLGTLRIDQLDFSEYNHDWTLTNITNSWDATAGYYYPLIDYGNCSTPAQFPTTAKHDWQFSAFRPAHYVYDYIDKIITDAGYTYESDFLETDFFKRLIIPNNFKNLIKRSNELINVSQPYTDNWLPLPASGKTIGYSTQTQLSNFTSSGGNTVYTYIGTEQVDSNFYFNFLAAINLTYTGSGTLTVRYRVIKNSTINVYDVSNDFILSYGQSVSDIIQAYFEDTVPISFVTNDFITTRIDLIFTWDYDSNTSSYGYLEDGQVDLNYANIDCRSVSYVIANANYGDALEMNLNLPKGVYQKDFFSSIVKMFNLYVVEDRDKSKHLKIEPYISFYLNDAELYNWDDNNQLLVDGLGVEYLLIKDAGVIAVNWSTKIDRSKPIRLKPMSELNGRYYEYKYKQDNDYYNEQYQKRYTYGYGDRIVDTGYEFAKEKQTLEIIFAATPLVGYDGEEKVYPTIMKLSNTNAATKTEDRTEHVIRIMQKKKVTGVTGYDIYNNLVKITPSQLTYYGYGGHLDDPDAPSADLNFGAPNELYFELVDYYPEANVFNSFWSDYVAEITDKDSKLLTCYVYLNELDIFHLDFSKLIYIDGSLWRLNQIIDYNPSTKDVTKVELLKVIEITYA